MRAPRCRRAGCRPGRCRSGRGRGRWTTSRADTHDTSCSALRPPNRTTSRSRGGSDSSFSVSVAPLRLAFRASSTPLVEPESGTASLGAAPLTGDPGGGCQTRRMRIAVRELADAVGGRLVGDPASGGGVPPSTGPPSTHAVAGRPALRRGRGRPGRPRLRGMRRRPPVRRRRWCRATSDASLPQVLVDDTGAALLEAGRMARARIDAPVVGITGSVGKTTTKDLLASILATRSTVAAVGALAQQRARASPSPCSTPPPTPGWSWSRWGPVASATSALLCDVARPTIGVVTAVAAAHTEMFGSIEAVARGEGRAGRVAAVDGDRGAQHRSAGGGDGVTDRGAGRDVRRRGRRACRGGRARRLVAADLHAAIAARLDRVALGVAGRHQITNALAALRRRHGVRRRPRRRCRRAWRIPSLSPWRMELGRSARGRRGHQRRLQRQPHVDHRRPACAGRPSRARPPCGGARTDGRARRRRGRRPPEVAASASRLGIELVAVGTDLYGVARRRPRPTRSRDPSPLHDGDALLVKGSRVAGLERVARSVLELVEE